MESKIYVLIVVTVRKEEEKKKKKKPLNQNLTSSDKKNRLESKNMMTTFTKRKVIQGVEQGHRTFTFNMAIWVKSHMVP